MAQRAGVPRNQKGGSLEENEDTFVANIGTVKRKKKGRNFKGRNEPSGGACTARRSRHKGISAPRVRENWGDTRIRAPKRPRGIWTGD